MPYFLMEMSWTHINQPPCSLPISYPAPCRTQSSQQIISKQTTIPFQPSITSHPRIPQNPQAPALTKLINHLTATPPPNPPISTNPTNPSSPSDSPSQSMLNVWTLKWTHCLPMHLAAKSQHIYGRPGLPSQQPRHLQLSHYSHSRTAHQLSMQHFCQPPLACNILHTTLHSPLSMNMHHHAC